MSEVIYSKDTALLMLKIRNLIWEELGIRIRLSEEGALQRFIELGESSESPAIRATVAELCTLLDLNEAEESSEPLEVAGGQRLYRGVAVAKGRLGRTRTPPPVEQPLAGAKGKVITYRGQKMVV